MAKHILKCPNHGYTMQAKCPVCSEKTVSIRPPKYSPEDRFAKYRRQAKFEDGEPKATAEEKE